METENFIPCTPKELPPDLFLASAETAIRINPVNAPAFAAMAAIGIVLPPGHLAVLTGKYWGNRGVKLTVGFMEETPADLREMILSHMNAWDAFANLKFAWTQTDPQVRITRSGNGYWSYLGTDILHIPKNEPTMCLQGFTMAVRESERRRVIRHECGHTAGFPHEHARRDIVNRLDPQKTIEYFRRTQNWSAATTQAQVLTPLEDRAIQGTPVADESSIMCYQLPGSITKDGQPIPGGMDFTEEDKRFANQIYPDDIVAPPPPPPPGPPMGTADIKIHMSLDTKTIQLKLPVGWRATKAAGTLDEGEDIMTDAEKNRFVALAAELEASLPKGEALKAAQASAPLGGIIGKVMELIAALKAGDWKVIGAAVRDLFILFFPLEGGDGGVINFSQQSAALGFDWSVLKAVLKKLLPLVLEFL